MISVQLDQRTCDPCLKCGTLMVWAEYLSPQGAESIFLRCPGCDHKASKWLKKPGKENRSEN